MPVGSEEAPFVLDISVAGIPAPFTENFDQAVSRWSLYDLGWAEYASGFQGATWELSETNAYNGSWSAYHAAAPADETISDWLVSPALDMRGLSTAQVTWHQLTTGAEAGAGDLPPAISLWASTTGGDPTEPGNGFQKVIDVTLEAEDGWERIPVIDPSSYAGEQRLYLAWNYEEAGGTGSSTMWSWMSYRRTWSWSA